MDSDSKIYLLEKNCTYYIETAEIHVNGTLHSHLDNLESAIFKQLLAQPNTLVSYETLFKHWQNRYVGDGVLTRVVSSLRAKLKNAGCQQLKIVNKTKRGYILCGDIKPVPTRLNLSRLFKALLPSALLSKPIVSTSAVSIFKNTKPIVFLITFVVLLAAFIPFYSVLEGSRPISKLPAEGVTITQFIVEDETLKHRLAFNPSEQMLAYETIGVQHKTSAIQVKNLATNLTVLLDSEDALYSPQWRSDYSLVYKAVNANHCFIKQVNFTTTLEVSDPINLYRCDENALAHAVATYQNNALIFTDAMVKSEANQLTVTNLNGIPIQKIHFPSLKNKIIYQIVTAPQSNSVIILATEDWKTTQIIKTSAAEKWQIAWQYESPIHLHSVAWNGSELSFKSSPVELTRIQFEPHYKEYARHADIGLEFHSPTMTKTGIAVITNNVHGKQLVKIDPNTNERTTLFDVPPNMYFIGINHKAKFMFIRCIKSKLRTQQPVSNLYEWNPNGNQFDLVTQIPFENPSHFSFSPTEQTLTFEHESHIVYMAYGRKAEESRIIRRIPGSKPLLLKKHLYFIQNLNGFNTVVRTLANNNHADVQELILANLYAEKSGKLIYSYLSQLGVWEFKQPFNQLLSNTDFRVTTLLASDNLIYFKQSNGVSKVFTDKKVSPLTLLPTEKISAVDDQYLYAVINVNSISSLALVK